MIITVLSCFDVFSVSAQAPALEVCSFVNVSYCATHTRAATPTARQKSIGLLEFMLALKVYFHIASRYFLRNKIQENCEYNS